MSPGYTKVGGCLDTEWRSGNKVQSQLLKHAVSLQDVALLQMMCEHEDKGYKQLMYGGIDASADMPKACRSERGLHVTR